MKRRYSVSENCVCLVIGTIVGLIILSYILFSAAIINNRDMNNYKRLLSDVRAELQEAQNLADDWKIECYKAQNALEEFKDGKD